MSEQEKNWQRIHHKSSKKKNCEITGVSLWLLSSPDLNPVDHALWDVLKSKSNATSYPNIRIRVPL